MAVKIKQSNQIHSKASFSATRGHLKETKNTRYEDVVLQPLTGVIEITEEGLQQLVAKCICGL